MAKVVGAEPSAGSAAEPAVIEAAAVAALALLLALSALAADAIAAKSKPVRDPVLWPLRLTQPLVLAAPAASDSFPWSA